MTKWDCEIYTFHSDPCYNETALYQLSYLDDVTLVFPPRPDHGDDVDDSADDLSDVEGHVLVEVGVSEDEVPIYSVGLDDEAPAKQGHMVPVTVEHRQVGACFINLWENKIR